MDLLSALPEEVFNEVASYLNVKDIRKGSLVCKGWYQMFGQSKECMQKVTIKFSSQNYNNDLNPLLNTNRKYQNLNIGFPYKHIKELGVEPKIRSVLKKFAKSLVKLETTHDFQRICELPKLKELKYNSYQIIHYGPPFTYFYSNGLIATCLNVNKLDISCEYLHRKHLGILQEALKNMRDLKQFAVDKPFHLTNLNPTDCKFRLESFELRESRISNIYNFMMHHRSTLKSIKITCLSLEDIEFIFIQFPILHTLQIHHFDFYPLKTWEMPENLTLKNLSVTSERVHNCEKLIPMLPKLKNLQKINLAMLYSELLPVLFTCPSLTLVKYQKLANNVTEDQKSQLMNNENIKFIHIPSKFYR